VRHLARGWNIFTDELGEFIEILPASQRVGGEWYQGTADAVYQNLDIIRSLWPEYVLILGGDHVYKMDYGPMLAAHVEADADLTVGCLEVPVGDAAGNFGVCGIDGVNRITEFQEKPEQPTPLPGSPGLCLASMGIYIFNTRFLYERLIADADDPKSRHDFGANVVPSAIRSYRVVAYPFKDPSGKQAYWRDVGTIDSFYQANMELVDVVPELNLYDQTWPILTHQAQLPPAKFVFNDDDGRRGFAVDSMVSGGCVISGAALNRSLLFSNVRIDARSQVNETVVLPDCTIGPDSRIRHAILDRGCAIPAGTVIGHDPEQDRARGFRVSEDGVVLVTPDMLGQSIHFVR
jgi:glucose-1-phosphate adenylyltransferase